MGEEEEKGKGEGKGKREREKGKGKGGERGRVFGGGLKKKKVERRKKV